ncbi:MAG: hypothetical protein OEY34_04175 [Cyclobacteriaceae bacterium]|nr:hypothetical protein [Cyclobacteriaceae bacterium]
MDQLSLSMFISLIIKWLEAAWTTLQLRYIFISYGSVYIISEISPLKKFFEPRSEVKKRFRKFGLGFLVFSVSGYIFYLQKIKELKAISAQNDYMANLIVSYILIIIIHHIGLKKFIRGIKDVLSSRKEKPQTPKNGN